MNKAQQINLGGMPFTIDEDAFRRLDLYLSDLENYFSDSESKDEIISDIEARLAELLRESLQGRNIVSLKDVADAIKIMGSPEDFEDEPVMEGEGRTARRGSWDIKTGKKLYRDPDNKVIGGVCSGLSAYFGIEDPVWLRLGFVIVFLTMGFGAIVYIVAWALIPEAKTSADRLAMMGHPANVKNIADMIERGLDDLGETIKDNWSGFRKKKSNAYTGESSVRRSGKGGIHALSNLPDFSNNMEKTMQKAVKSVTTKLNSQVKKDQFLL